MTQNNPTAKVLFRVVNDEDDSAEVETLWAFDLGGDNYRLTNSPFWAYGVSWKDIVYAPYDEEEKFPTFQRVVEKSGNRTIRIIFDPPVGAGNESDRVLQELVRRGCSYEGAWANYMAINIPQDVALESVMRYLIECEAEREHADPTHDELYPEDA